MIYRRVLHKLWILPVVILAAAVFGFVVMDLWNYIVPAVFGGKVITFWQAVGLLVLSRILFGGFFRGHRMGEHRRGRRLIWEQLTPEERERVRAGMKHGCGRPGEGGPVEA